MRAKQVAATAGGMATGGVPTAGTTDGIIPSGRDGTMAIPTGAGFRRTDGIHPETGFLRWAGCRRRDTRRRQIGLARASVHSSICSTQFVAVVHRFEPNSHGANNVGLAVGTSVLYRRSPGATHVERNVNQHVFLTADQTPPSGLFQKCSRSDAEALGDGLGVAKEA